MAIDKDRLKRAAAEGQKKKEIPAHLVPPPDRKCTHFRADGSPCPNWEQRKGLGSCYYHNPENAERLAEGRRRGGLGNRKPKPYLIDLNDIDIQDSDDMVKLMNLLMTKLLKGELEMKMAMCVAQLAQVALKALQDSKIRKVEDMLEELKNIQANGATKLNASNQDVVERNSKTASAIASAIDDTSTGDAEEGSSERDESSWDDTGSLAEETSEEPLFEDFDAM